MLNNITNWFLQVPEAHNVISTVTLSFVSAWATRLCKLSCCIVMHFSILETRHSLSEENEWEWMNSQWMSWKTTWRDLCVYTNACMFLVQRPQGRSNGLRHVWTMILFENIDLLLVREYCLHTSLLFWWCTQACPICGGVVLCVWLVRCLEARESEVLSRSHLSFSTQCVQLVRDSPKVVHN